MLVLFVENEMFNVSFHWYLFFIFLSFSKNFKSWTQFFCGKSLDPKEDFGRLKIKIEKLCLEKYVDFSFFWKSIYLNRKIRQKELNFCHKLRFSNSNNLATRFPRPFIFQTINSGRSNSLSLKYQRFTPSGCKDRGVRKFKFVAKTQFLSIYFLLIWK